MPTTGIIIHKPFSPAAITEVYDSYWKFASLRQEAFFNRVQGKPLPWTMDQIISRYKFTNVYRAADRVSQFLINKVIYNDQLPTTPKEILFRILLFKLFNKIETWELLTAKLGRITYEDYRFDRYDNILAEHMGIGKKIYSAAYIMPSGKSFFGFERKHSNHLKLIELILKNNTVERLAEARRMQDAFEILKSFSGIGNFLAYQLLIDINYSELLQFSESEFVVPGPGALGGISKCFRNTGGLSHVEIIKVMTDRQEKEFERLQLPFRTLWGRRLQLIDCQNIFCEVDKYARVKHPDIKGSSERVKIKQIFKANPALIRYRFPPKWNINQYIKDSDSHLFTLCE